jgi:predicted pyridoxine 5'-phosphate oxidase superfamily flavin-nucleotide-binding protein
MSDKSNNPIADPAIRRLFEGKNLVFIASLMKDGSPQVTPTWVDIEDGTIVINTAVGKEAEDHADKLTKKYLGIDRYIRRAPDEERILLKIKPEKIFHMH